MSRGDNGGNKIKTIIPIIGVIIALIVASGDPIRHANERDARKIASEGFSDELANIINDACSDPYKVTRSINQPEYIISINTLGAELKIIYMSVGLWGEPVEKDITKIFPDATAVDLSGFRMEKGTYKIEATQRADLKVYVECKKVP